MSIKSRVSTTPNSVMGDAEIQHQWQRARHLRKRSVIWSTIQSCVFLTPEWSVHVLRWSPRGSNWNFLQPQVASGFSAITGIWDPMEAEKKVCQRLTDQVSSLRWDLICPSQLMGLKKRIRLGESMKVVFYKSESGRGFDVNDLMWLLFIFSRIKKRRKPKVKIVTLQLGEVKKSRYSFYEKVPTCAA